MEIKKLLQTYPRKREKLPMEYERIYTKHYKENRGGITKVSSISRRLEYWMHRKVAKTSLKESKTLELGGGNLNQLDFEHTAVYDVVEPYQELYQNSSNLCYVRNVYSDISEIKNEQYDRIISVACLEHVENLPAVVSTSTKLLKPGGKMCAAIPNEGKFLWKLAYTMTTGREFKKRYGLDYERIMRYEHLNTADEIEQILNYYFENVKKSLFGISREFAFYRYYECDTPRKKSMKACS